MANNDNAMTRFLFAILKQKNLKDIDWNEVARDPILAQPITNGHAARMRYSRFKQSMLGLEPQKRSKGGVAKKSAKQKKDHKDTSLKQEDNIKQEIGLNRPYGKPMGISSRKIKQEQAQSPFQSTYTTASASPTVVESAREASLRLLTPCSDDMLAETASLAMSPAANFDLGHCTHGDGHESSGHDGWDHASLYFDNAYGLDQFGTSLCEHQHDSSLAHASDIPTQDALLHDHTHDFATASAALLQSGMSAHAHIKRESWDSQGH